MAENAIYEDVQLFEIINLIGEVAQKLERKVAEEDMSKQALTVMLAEIVGIHKAVSAVCGVYKLDFTTIYNDHLRYYG